MKLREHKKILQDITADLRAKIADLELQLEQCEKDRVSNREAAQQDAATINRLMGQLQIAGIDPEVDVLRSLQ